MMATPEVMEIHFRILLGEQAYFFPPTPRFA